ncbi:MAG: DUF4432 family protein [Oscillospiraceae bacterium]
MFETRVSLRHEMFSRQEEVLLEAGEFSAGTFRYSTGVEALRIRNGRGEIVLLPFQGQQVWRAGFLGRELTMHTTFPEPIPTRDYLGTYGGFLIHCGAIAMGVPSAEDSHPLHGELPNIPYGEAYLRTGSDEKGDYIAAGGMTEVRIGFELYYRFRPEIRLYAGATVLEVSSTLENMRSTPMDYMYMCHINFLPLEGGELVYSAPSDREHVSVFVDVPDNLSEGHRKKLQQYMDAVEKNPKLHDKIGGTDQIYDPEMVLSVKYRADGEGYGHCMQRRGELADYVGFRVAELPCGIRWISRTGDEDAIGFLLPATADHKGRTAAERRGLLRSLSGGESVTFSLRAGCLDEAAADAMAKRIAGVLDKPAIPAR